MKKLFTILVAVLLTASVFAQTPQKMSYQAVIRNSSDDFVTNTQIGMEINILQGSASGTVVYTETQTPTTNANGLVSIEIGGEAGFSDIDWANDTYYIETKTDPTGGTTYTITGTSQLMSVPYALHAKTAETITGTMTETDPTYTSSEAANITVTDITNLSNLSNINTGDQDISGIVTNTQAIQDTASQIRADILDVSGLLTSEIDPTYTSSQAVNITVGDITNLSNLSNINTGDQDISGIVTNTQAIQDTASQIRADIPDVSGLLTSEIDPTYTSSQAVNITAGDITNLSNLSNTNTGDQDLSALATKTALGDSITLVRSEIPTSISDLTMNANSQNITNIANPTNAQDAATKAYVDLLELRLENLMRLLDIPIVGDSSGGGIIAYIFIDGDPGYVEGETHGLIAATADQSTGIQWYNGSNTTTGATATALGTGNANTNTIVASQGTGSYAAQLCADLILGGYDDWYLPSEDELSKLYINKDAIGGFNDVVGAYGSDAYWSSTEFYEDNYALKLNFSSGKKYYTLKYTAYRVRAIRAF